MLLLNIFLFFCSCTFCALFQFNLSIQNLIYIRTEKEGESKKNGLLAAAKFSCQAIAMTLFSKHSLKFISTISNFYFLFYLLDSFYMRFNVSFSFPHGVSVLFLSFSLFYSYFIANQNTSRIIYHIYFFWVFKRFIYSNRIVNGACFIRLHHHICICV